MNKNDASKYLEIGLRTLERHTSAGRITAKKVKTPNGPALDYEEAELERFRRAVLEPAELEAPAPSPPPLPGPANGVAEVALARIEPQALARHQAQAIDVVTVPVEVLAKLADVAATVAGRRAKPQALLGEKLTLSLDEAVAFSGVPRSLLRTAIGDGKLVGRKVGRTIRVQRVELERFVSELMA